MLLVAEKSDHVELLHHNCLIEALNLSELTQVPARDGKGLKF